MRFRLQFPVLVIAACAFGACTAERTGSLRAMGRWAENDTRTFYNDITGAPAWLTGQVRADARNFGESMSFVVSKTSHDLKTGKELVVDSPAYLSKEFKRDWRALSGTAASVGDWTGQDARNFYQNAAGAPTYLAKHSDREFRDFKYQFNEIVRQFRDDAKTFPAHIWETLELLFIR